MPCFFPRDVLDEILDLIESVSEGFPTYSCKIDEWLCLSIAFSDLKFRSAGSSVD